MDKIQTITVENKQEKELINRREALTKAGYLSLSAATMMILMKSQPAKAASTAPEVVNSPSSSGETWVRTSR